MQFWDVVIPKLKEVFEKH